MAELKKYSFEIQTVKNYQDENSPHLLSTFEFVAENREKAEKYMKSLIEHFNENMPYRHPMPRTASILSEINIE